jgi:HlyD family secretion protein
MSLFESSDLARLSIEQDGYLWPAMFLDTHKIEVLRGDHRPALGRTRLVVEYGEVTAAISATVTKVDVSQLGHRLTLSADDEDLWAYCLNAAKSNELEMPRLIASTRPGIGPKIVASGSAGNYFFARNWPKMTATVLAVAVLTLGYQRLFFASSAEASVATDEIVVAASGSGRVIFATRQDQVREGEPVVGLARSRSRDRAMESPCDCMVSRRLVTRGSWVGKADPLITLSRLDAPRYVRALLPAADIPQLLRGGTLTFEFQDGSRSRVPVPVHQIINASKSVKPGLVELNLHPGYELPARMIGQAVKVSYAALPAAIETLMGPFGALQ